MTTQKERQIAIYSRKSKFTGKGESIENQIELCRQYIKLHYSDSEAENCLIFEDEGFSGKNLERPQFKKMLAAGRDGRLSAIIVYRLDRISRNIGDFAALIESFDSLQISFVSIKEQFDTRSPMGRAMMYIASVFSQLERETIAERIRDNMQELAKTGRWLGGVTPTGYISEKLTREDGEGRIKASCRLKLFPSEAEIVKQIFDCFLKKGSLADTERCLREEGCRTKKGNAFSRFAIKGILSNPVYMAADEAACRYFMERGAQTFYGEQVFDGRFGIIAYNRTEQKQGRANLKKNLSEWIVAVGEHEGLISGKDWIKAQQLLEENKRPGRTRKKENVSALSGCLFCKDCGSCMRTKLGASPCRDCSEKERRFSYVCTGREKSRGKLCSMKNIRGRELEEKVCLSLGCLSEDRRIFIKKLEHIQKEFDAEYTGESGEWLSDAEMEKLTAFLSSFEELVKCQDGEITRRILKALVRQVIWDGRNAHVYVLHTQDSIDNK